MSDEQMVRGRMCARIRWAGHGPYGWWGSGGPERGTTFLQSKLRPARTGQPKPRPAEHHFRRVDLDDMFGLRRALSSLPERFHDRFVERWVQLGGRCEYDVQAL